MAFSWFNADRFPCRRVPVQYFLITEQTACHRQTPAFPATPPATHTWWYPISLRLLFSQSFFPLVLKVPLSCLVFTSCAQILTPRKKIVFYFFWILKFVVFPYEKHLKPEENASSSTMRFGINIYISQPRSQPLQTATIWIRLLGTGIHSQSRNPISPTFIDFFSEKQSWTSQVYIFHHRAPCWNQT